MCVWGGGVVWGCKWLPRARQEPSEVVSKEKGRNRRESNQRVQTLRIERMGTDGSLFE